MQTNESSQFIQFPIRAEIEIVVPDVATNKAFPLLIALHGYGERAQIMREFAAPIAGSDMILAALNGPHQFYRISKSQGERVVGFSWLSRHDREGGLDTCESYIRNTIDRLVESHSIDQSRIILMAFSQSCSLAYTLALRNPEMFAGLVILSPGSFPEYSLSLLDNCAKPQRIFVGHGREDQFHSVDALKTDVERIRVAGHSLDLHLYDMGHDRSPAEAAEIRTWLVQNSLQNPNS